MEVVVGNLGAPLRWGNEDDRVHRSSDPLSVDLFSVDSSSVSMRRRSADLEDGSEDEDGPGEEDSEERKRLVYVLLLSLCLAYDPLIDTQCFC